MPSLTQPARRLQLRLKDRALKFGATTLLEGLEQGATWRARAAGPGVFLSVRKPCASSVHRTVLGRLPQLRRFTACARYEPYWMKPCFGTRHAEIPIETQCLLADVGGGLHAYLVPLCDTVFRYSLSSDGDGIMLHAETGDPLLVGAGTGPAVYIAVGSDPYALAEEGARVVARAFGTKTRSEKPLPEFVRGFGWCTWDAFYQDVSAAGVLQGLAAFKRGGVSPRFMILDDGWQPIRTMPSGENRMTGFEAVQPKFPMGLRGLVQTAKEQFGLREFLVWHALTGYWGGVDGAALPGYEVRTTPRSYGPGLLAASPVANHHWWGQLVGVVPPSQIAAFYDDFHSHLAASGVDGVKVDNQGMLESVAAGHGGRVALTRVYRRALEASVAKHFGGRLINCMSHATETFLQMPGSNLLRSSTDFWPKKPETHGLHLSTNAHVGLWFGEFMHPDWDMFQSAHEWGPYHAAGRVVGGAPIYVSDKPGKHDFRLLRQLVLPDGTVPLCDGPGRPSPDSLFQDPTCTDTPLKIFNRCGRRGLVGVFHGRYASKVKARPQSSRVQCNDIPGLAAGPYVVYSRKSDALLAPSAKPLARVALAQGEWDLVSFVPADRGIAVIGLADMLNSGATVLAERWLSTRCRETTLAASGRVLAWTRRAPKNVTAGGRPARFTWSRGRLEIHLARKAGAVTVSIEL